jgi:O-acetylhomoserine/O-acetylserine sulfhydrylase-like pyridoxal-dependent enzyme
MGRMRDRKQIALLPEYIDDYIGQDNPVGTGLGILARPSRLSVGLEDSKDLIDDLRQALDAVRSHS